ncbi:MAG: hypothetical protein SPF99_00190 [Anaerobutyricum sp.]|nr:hypothetical protein [Anaerobutyricum sp.]
MRNKIKKKVRFFIGIIVICIIIGGIYVYMKASSMITSIENYNVAVEMYNTESEKYNELLENCCVDNISDMPSEMGLLKREKESFIATINAVCKGNSKEKIEKDTKTIDSLIRIIKTNNQIVQQITSPKEEWVIHRLKNVSEIKSVEQVTEKNNPDGLLGKSGGYNSCVYFSIKNLDVKDVSGNTVVEKGVDGGGIEIYSTLEDAEKRCNYLQGFDDTILYSGSYAIVGTMVVRTSYLLSEEDQLYLTNKIVEAFTLLDD